uniref:hypothetical protein n=1 Tax=Aeromonas salmonicida TaxID=645 RepID=UPI00155D8C6B|nr:hypothetical protein [Aeromonas salmonicida]
MIKENVTMIHPPINEVTHADLKTLLLDERNVLEALYCIPFEGKERASDGEKTWYRIVFRVRIGEEVSELVLMSSRRGAKKYRSFRDAKKVLEYIDENFDVAEVHFLRKFENDFNSRLEQP